MDIMMELNNPRFRNDTYFEKISRDDVSCKDADIAVNNQLLQRVVVDDLITRMKIKDSEFENLFETVMYGGSFYKGLKVSKPDEYDLNLVMKLNINYSDLEVEPDNNNPGFVTVRTRQRVFNRNQRFWNAILDETGYLNQNKFRSWMQSVVTRTLNDPQHYGRIYVVPETYTIIVHQSGPAFTFSVISTNRKRRIDFDLVPCLVFENKILRNYRRSTLNKWIVIAKPLGANIPNDSRLWRTSFYLDEKEILKGDLKPIIRMMKKLRDVKRWSELKSYFIETFFLNLLQDNNFAKNYSKVSKNNAFMFALRRLQRQLESGHLPHFWQSNENILSKINPTCLRNISNEMTRIINRIDDNITRDDSILLRIFQEP